MSLSILGTGSALPKHVVTNEDLTAFLDTSDEWIRTRTGIGQRHLMTDESLLDLTEAAARAALENAGTAPDDIDYILCCTMAGDYVTPSLACQLQATLGATCPALDLNAACSGFIYGLDVAAGLFATGRAKRILMVAAEALSRITDWTDRATCVLFGDAAAAVVLGPGDALQYLSLESMGNWDVLYAPSYSGFKLGQEEGNYGPGSYLHMDGQEVYKFAVGAIERGINGALAATGTAAAEVDHVLLHQANLRIIQAAQKKLDIPAERWPTIIQRTGNVSAVSIPLLLDEENRAGHFKRGDTMVFCAFGGGLTAGTALVRWDK